MATTRLRIAEAPDRLLGWVAVDRHGRPRYWATLWADVISAKASAGTRRTHLTAVDRLYDVVDDWGQSQITLDSLLAGPDFDAIEEALSALLARFRNENAIRGFDRSVAWHAALNFVTDVLRRASVEAALEGGRIERRIRRIEKLFRALSPTPPSVPIEIRALPAIVVEDLYAVFNPRSDRNPFKTETLRQRNLLIFLTLLHLGVRRGELAMLRVDAMWSELDANSAAHRFWLNVEKGDDVDPRAEEPSLKTPYSRRQLPLAHELAQLMLTYAKNYRGRANHPFLLTSQKGKPLSMRQIQDVFEVANEALSPEALHALKMHRRPNATAHPIRHTAAVARLKRYVDAGHDMQAAMEKLRVFFGWSPDSKMPRHYARAYFEPTLQEVMNDRYDSFIEDLKALEGVQS